MSRTGVGNGAANQEKGPKAKEVFYTAGYGSANLGSNHRQCRKQVPISDSDKRTFQAKAQDSHEGSADRKSRWNSTSIFLSAAPPRRLPWVSTGPLPRVFQHILSSPPPPRPGVPRGTRDRGKRGELFHKLTTPVTPIMDSLGVVSRWAVLLGPAYPPGVPFGTPASQPSSL